MEIGCEELPATSVERAFQSLKSGIAERLKEAKIEFVSNQSLGTPRRLIVSFEGVSERQPDENKEVRGPSLQAAYDEAGNPKPPLLGFCKSQGIAPEDVVARDGYIWASVTVKGRPTAEVLAEIVPDALKAIPFDKTLRWGTNRVRFGRPVRWILARLGSEPVPFEFAGVHSGGSSCGHRFLSPDPFEATGFDELLVKLRERQVEPDPAIRRQRIVEQSISSTGGRVQMEDDLLEENVYLTEWPMPLLGEFDPAFLDLPEAVLVTAMAKHERFFPVRTEQGQLLNQFVSVRNSGDEETVRKGNVWVLNARFNDAQFFLNEDSNFSLDQFLERTQRLVFQDGLGNVHQRSARLEKLAAFFALQLGASEEEQQLAAKAGKYAKADLSSGLVSELPALQGGIGSEYARRGGFELEVCEAIGSQYVLDDFPLYDKVSLALILADHTDKLAGNLGIGNAPSGSSDPVGLRRSAQVLVKIGAALPEFDNFPLKPGFNLALELYVLQGIDLSTEEALSAFRKLISSRYEATILAGARPDLIAAAVFEAEPDAPLDPSAVQLRYQYVSELALDTSLIQTLTRPLNILKAARQKNETIPEDLRGEELVEPTEQALYAQVVAGASLLPLPRARALKAPIDQFFDTVMVMDEDPKVRANRLALLAQVEAQIAELGDVTKVVLADKP